MAGQEQQPVEDPHEEEDWSTDDDDYDKYKDEWEKYSKQITESEGFEVDEFPILACWKEIIPHDFENYPLELTEFTNNAIRSYNYKEKASLEFVEIVNVTCRVSCASFYITFKAKDGATGKIDTYQTLVNALCGGTVSFMRLKPGTKPEVGPSGIKVRERDAEEEKEGKRLKG